jgi:hypothetical protein
MSSSSKKDGQHSQTKWVEISVGDTTIPVYVCTPAQGKPKGAILVFQEVFGVNSHIRSVAERCAAEGYLALAPDLFHRQGHRYEAAYSDIKSAAARSQLMSEEQLLADIDRVIATLDERMKIGVLGGLSSPGLGRRHFLCFEVDRKSPAMDRAATVPALDVFWRERQSHHAR